MSKPIETPPPEDLRLATLEMLRNSDSKLRDGEIVKRLRRVAAWLEGEFHRSGKEPKLPDNRDWHERVWRETVFDYHLSRGNVYATIKQELHNETAEFIGWELVVKAKHSKTANAKVVLCAECKTVDEAKALFAASYPIIEGGTHDH